MLAEVAIDNPFSLDLGVPHIEQYFGLWAIQPEPFEAAVARVEGIDLRLHVEEQRQATTVSQTRASRADYPVTREGIALIQLTGPLMKYVSSLSGGTSTVLARRQIRQAARDEEVAAILLVVDSPGGTVAGTDDLAEEVARAGKSKPLYAYIEDLGASAAYAVAAQARKVLANRTALVGSIGTFAVIQDLSGRAAQLGVKVHVIRAGQFKGAGTPGTEITQEQLGEWQRIVDESNEFFIRGVAQGRRLAIGKVRDLADGRVHLAQAAVDLGLIDAVQTFDETLAQLTKTGGRGTARQDSSEASEAIAASQPESGAEPVSTDTDTPKAASLEDLEACLPGADDQFILGQLKKRATLDQAQSAWMEEQNRRIEAARKETEAAKAAAKRPGVEPLEEGQAAGETYDGDAVAEFNRLVRAKIDAGQERRRAILAVARVHPDLHEAYLRATNSQNQRVQTLIGERFAMARARD